MTQIIEQAEAPVGASRRATCFDRDQPPMLDELPRRPRLLPSSYRGPGACRIRRRAANPAKMHLKGLVSSSVRYNGAYASAPTDAASTHPLAVLLPRCRGFFADSPRSVCTGAAPLLRVSGVSALCLSPLILLLVQHAHAVRQCFAQLCALSRPPTARHCHWYGALDGTHNRSERLRGSAAVGSWSFVRCLSCLPAIPLLLQPRTLPCVPSTSSWSLSNCYPPSVHPLRSPHLLLSALRLNPISSLRRSGIFCFCANGISAMHYH